MKSVKILLISIITIFLSSLAHAELNINRVITSVEGSGKWITVRTSFYNVDSDNVTEIFRMGIDGNLEKGNFHALRFDEKSFRIPKEYSHESQPGRFFFAKYSVNSGAFRNLYNYLDTKNQANIEASCNYMNNSKVIDEILKTKSSNNERKSFLANSKAKKSLSYLLDLCVKTSAKVYVVDVQNYLSALGYNVGKIDGKWGRKSELGLAKFQTDRGLKVTTTASSELLRKMRSELGDSAPDLAKYSNSTQFFNDKGQIKGIIWSLNRKLAARKSINTFKAWHLSEGISGYGLYWSSNAAPSQTAITLLTPLWNYYYPEKSYNYPGVENFLMNRKWNHDAEYGKTIALDYRSSEYRDWFSGVVKNQITASKANGVMLDWWHDSHGQSNGFSKNIVRKSRHLLAEALRSKFGSNFIVMGNVNWGDETDVKYLNGVFMELYKKEANRLHNSSELKKIERTLIKYENELLEPKLIALEGWRKTSVKMGSLRSSQNINQDRNSESNRKLAKLMTAMSAVISTNSYILYGDNNQDTPNGDHAHLLYDFYSFDIGKPTSGYNKIKSGVGYKEHDRGFIAYNITGSSKKFKRKNGQEHTIEAKSGLFCKDVGAKTECLSNN